MGRQGEVRQGLLLRLVLAELEEQVDVRVSGVDVRLLQWVELRTLDLLILLLGLLDLLLGELDLLDLRTLLTLLDETLFDHQLVGRVDDTKRGVLDELALLVELGF